MKKLGTFKIISIVTILLLLSGCIYFYNKSEKESKKPNNRIMIGTHVDKVQINFSEPISSIDDANFIQFAIMSAVSVSNPTVINEIPNMAIWIDSWTQGFGYFHIDLWIKDNKVIFDMGEYSGKHQYKEIDGKYAQEFIKRISTYKIKS